jgi:hypothetical protein
VGTVPFFPFYWEGQGLDTSFLFLFIQEKNKKIGGQLASFPNSSKTFY